MLLFFRSEANLGFILLSQDIEDLWCPVNGHQLE